MTKFLEKIKSHSPSFCIICASAVHKNSAYIEADGVCVCADCYKRITRYSSSAVFSGDKYLNFVVSTFPYEGELKKSFLDFKFKGQRAYSKVYEKLMEKELSDLISGSDFDILVPVPLALMRQMERGYNQASLMFCDFARFLNIEFREDLLFRIRNTLPQSTLSSTQRNENIKGAFLADAKKVKGKRILLADDIYTRGATLRECAKTLIDSGAKSVSGITFFKTNIEEKEEQKYRF